MDSALTDFPYLRKLFVSITRDTNEASGKKNPKERTPLNPELAMSPGFITKVAALVIDTANDKPTKAGEKFTLPTA